MKRGAIILAVVAAALASGSPAYSATYFASLSGANENPSNASPGTGTATVILDTTAHTLQVIATFSGLTSGTTASHIHCCVAPPGNAGVATTTPTFPGFPLGVTSGSYNQTFNTLQASTWNPAFITASGGTPAGAEAALAAGLVAGQAYFNIHTTNFPAGEIRGFLAGVSVGAVPTLSEWALAALALLLTLAAWRTFLRRS